MHKLKIGSMAKINRSFTEDDVRNFASISTDTNPIHFDAEFAESTIFGQRIVHGSLVASLFSALLANKIPENETIYLGQSLNFKAPCFLNEMI